MDRDRDQQPEPEGQSACPPPRPPSGTRATAGSSEPDDPAQLIYREARRAGLTDVEAREVRRKLTAEVAERVANGTLNPGDSRKTWLLRLTCWQIIDTLRMRRTISRA